ncbi:urease accessory protein UreE [Stappia sp. F7233]|uniref:Urease accessory protein UreE n=1 Tax=Stappia albiluteola TaxID=2758565 RepID=A0A839ADG0_9HYPH|nr:urease accessory protein UreE [Stappia albiluteola]MBA5777068.1 urease accessory protein UreE [Stappia albiluteola]
MRACDVRSAGNWHGSPADTITLDETARHRRRIMLTSDSGIEFLLDLAEAVLLRHGDGLVLDDGRVIEVRAAPEELLEVRGTSAEHLLRLAWHLGNRHLAAQIEKERILIRRDHVIADMLARLGATVAEVVEPFTPEGGAYGGHHHDHGHNHGHGHHHGHDHDH